MNTVDLSNKQHKKFNVFWIFKYKYFSNFHNLNLFSHEVKCLLEFSWKSNKIGKECFWPFYINKFHYWIFILLFLSYLFYKRFTLKLSSPAFFLHKILWNLTHAWRIQEGLKTSKIYNFSSNLITRKSLMCSHNKLCCWRMISFDL